MSRVHADGPRHGQLASGPRRSPTSRPARSAGSWWRARRCWPAGSATSCSPTTTAAVAAASRWPAPRCTAGWARHRRRGAAVPALPRPFRRRARRRRRRRNRWHAAHLEPIPLLVRDGVLSMAVHRPRRRERGMMSPDAYDVLARIRANRPAPQPAGERCEMCAEQIADEHQHVVNVEGRQLMCVCRGCYLLFTDTHASCATARCPTATSPSRTSRWTAAQWEALQIPVGLAFFFRNSALDRTVAFYPGPAGATESELDLAPGTTFAPPTRGWTCSPTTPRRCWCGCPTTRPQPPRLPSGADRRLLRVRRPAADAVARLRRRPGGRASSSTSSSSHVAARSKVVAP